MFSFLNFASFFELAYLRVSFSVLSENGVDIMTTKEGNNVGRKKIKQCFIRGAGPEIERYPVDGRRGTVVRQLLVQFVPSTPASVFSDVPNLDKFLAPNTATDEKKEHELRPLRRASLIGE